MRSRVGSATAVVMLAFLPVGCRDSVPPVAELEIEPTRLELSYPGFLTLRLRWRVKTELQEFLNRPNESLRQALISGELQYRRKSKIQLTSDAAAVLYSKNHEGDEI